MTNFQLWLRGGRPVVTAVRVMTCPTPTRGGMGALPMCGMGSSTTIVRITGALQPAELQDCRVTCLTPGVEKVTLGLATMEVEVAATHVLAGVLGGAAEDHGEEGLLLGGLSVHVDVVEESADAVVGEDLAVEDVDGGLDGGGAAKLFINRAHKDLLGG